MNTEKMDTEKDTTQTASEEKTGETQELQEAPAESENLTEQLQQCQLTLAEWQEKYARLTADLDNYKKRTIKERSTWAETAQMPLLVKLLTIVDNFDRAMEHQVEVPEEMRSWVDGMQMIHTAFKDFLKNAGVQEVSYEQFNPEYHEALLHVDSDAHDAGAIVEVMEKGYLLNDRVLRPAKVSVAK